MTHRSTFHDLPVADFNIGSDQFSNLLSLQESILGATVEGSAEKLLNDLCIFAEKLAEGAVATIMLYDEDSKTLTVRAAPSVAPDTFSALNGLKLGQGSCGNAVYHARPMYVCNTATDERWKDLRELADTFNIRACWSAPIRSAERVIGSFAISSLSVREPTYFQRKLLDVCATTAGILLQREASQLHIQRLEEERMFVESERFKNSKLESLGVLAGGLAHDFNNLLGVIRGNVDLACHMLGPKSKTLRYLEQAGTATVRASELTKQLLTFAKGGDPFKETTEIMEIIHSASAFGLHGSNVRCRYIQPDPLWAVSIDCGQISQVIQNLTINANQAMLNGGEIMFTCLNLDELDLPNYSLKTSGRYVKIEIKDTGPGIPAEDLGRVFDPYFTTKVDGSGLGLAVSYSIITKHNGYFIAESAPGEGATFTIYLPATEKTIEAMDPILVQEIHSEKPYRIMVMDDEKMIRDVTQDILASLGYTVLLCSDGQSAIELFNSSSNAGTDIDLVIMDLTIPGGMGGREAMRQILKITPNAKGIVSSGYSADPVIAHYSDYGFQAAIRKPYNRKKLGEIIKSVLENNEFEERTLT